MDVLSMGGLHVEEVFGFVWVCLYFKEVVLELRGVNVG